MKTKIQNYLFCAFSLLLLTFATRPATAATIQWTGANVTAPSDVSTNGTLVGAMNMGNTVPQIINGVNFIADPGDIGTDMSLGSGVTVQVSFGGGVFNNNLWADAAPGGDANYDDALDYGRNTSGAPLTNGTVTLGGLVTGTYYEVQLWLPDTRSCCSGRIRTVDGTLVLNAGGGPNIARGIFKADSSTQVINITPEVDVDGPQLNLLQLRTLVPNVVMNNNNSGPGSLRQAIADVASGETITFTNTLAGQTITLASEIGLSNSVAIDASNLSGGITVSGGATNRIFEIKAGAIVTLNSLTVANGHSGSTPEDWMGGGMINRGTLTLNHCAVTNNTAISYGGGIENRGSLFVNDSTISGNTGAGGGGIDNAGGDLVVANSTFFDNQGPYNGGAIFNNLATAIINNSTITGNSANFSSGGGIENYYSGHIFLTNSIVAGNTASSGSDTNNESGTTFSAANNLIGGDPQLAPLGNYGGATQTMPPLPGSPAIDAGAVSSLTTDQRGYPRLIGPATDIGAVEYNASPVVTTALNNGDGSLRNAITYSINNSTITFDSSLSGQTITLANQIMIKNAVTIDASGLAYPVKISGAAVTRVFYVTTGTFATFNSLTITNGHAPAGDFASNGGGGGVFCRGRADLLNCYIVNCSGSDFAGAVACDHGEIHLTACTLSGNSASSGGGIYNYYGTAMLTNSTLSGNFANGFGGAIVNLNASLSLTHCTLALNQSIGTNSGDDGGGAIDNYSGGTLTMTACLLTGNTVATGNGPDLWMESGTLNANYCLVSDGTSSTLVNDVNGNQVGTGVSPINALLAPLGNYGGPTPTMPPLFGSPAIDAGEPSFAATTDQRGYNRPVGPAADIGAVEMQVAYPDNLSTLKNVTWSGAGGGSPNVFQFTFTNMPKVDFTVQTTTNLALPQGGWTAVSEAVETPPGSGHYQFTDMKTTNAPQRFYRLVSPF